MKILTRKVVKTYTESINLETGEYRARLSNGQANTTKEIFLDEDGKILYLAPAEKLWLEKTKKP